MKRLVSIISPVYNEEESLSSFYGNLKKILDSLDNIYDFEIIFVDDGSADKTAIKIRDIIEIDKRVRLIKFTRNFGKEVAVTAGLGDCTGDAAILIDSDLQHPPDVIQEFITKWEKGSEVVVGVRKNNIDTGLVRRAGSFLFYKILQKISDTSTKIGATDFRLIDRVVINEFNRLTEKTRYTRGLIDWLGFGQDYVYFTVGSRHSGKPRYSLLKLTRLAVSGFVSLSLFPLRMAGYIGLSITAISGLVGLFIVIDKFILMDRWGFHFSNISLVVVLILFLVGVILICLGLVALYVANIHGEVINRPMYVIHSKFGYPKD